MFHPFTLTFDGPATIVASTEWRSVEAAAEARAREIERRRRVVAFAPSGDPLAVALTRAADQAIA